MKIKTFTAVTLSAVLTLSLTAFGQTCNPNGFIHIDIITEEEAEEIFSSEDVCEDLSQIFNNYLHSFEHSQPEEPENHQLPSLPDSLKPGTNHTEPTTEATTKYTEPTTEATTKQVYTTTETTTKHIQPTTEITTKYVKPVTETTTKYIEPTTETTTKQVQTTTETTTKENTTKYTEASTEATTSASSSASTSSNSSVANQILSLVNTERAAAGLSALTLDSSLTNAAMLKAQDMADNNYFSHTSPTYGTPFQMLQTLGISYKSAGENIAKGQKSAEAVMTAWMNSEGHKANILSSSYGKLGVGYVSQNGTTYWVQIFTD
ncbi:MAG: CAP domain-containing protein [Clostridiales bacterium]|nr:CAP domain-containing protein [Clostridiales bacterium]